MSFDEKKQIDEQLIDSQGLMELLNIGQEEANEIIDAVKKQMNFFGEIPLPDRVPKDKVFDKLGLRVEPLPNYIPVTGDKVLPIEDLADYINNDTQCSQSLTLLIEKLLEVIDKVLGERQKRRVEERKEKQNELIKKYYLKGDEQ